MCRIYKKINLIRSRFHESMTRNNICIFLRLIIIFFFIFVGPVLLIDQLTPPDYTVRFKRECDGIKCEKIREVNSERSISIENEIKTLSSSLERIDFFARFTFLRFDFQITNKSQLTFVVTQPRYEKGVDMMMECYLEGHNYIFSPNSGIIFMQKSSIGDIISNLSKIQNILINCNPAAQNIENVADKPLVVGPKAYVKFIYDEEKYHLKFLPDRLNYFLTVFQMFLITGIFLGAYYEIVKFIRRGLKE